MPRKEHHCEGMPPGVEIDFNTRFSYWELSSDDSDQWLRDINHCPWCGVKLETEVAK